MDSIAQSAATFALLPGRTPIAVTGEDALVFLQGLVSNDVAKAAHDRAVYAALLTAQGKFLHDFFVARLPDGLGGGLVLDAEAARADDLIKRLKLYKLRSRVTIAPLAGHAIAAVWGSDADEALSLGVGLAYPDPRLAAAGVRLILPAATAHVVLTGAGFAEGNAAGYDAHRLSLGLPDGSRDIEVEKSTLLECGFEELHGVDFQKGCYMGQELTARTKYRGLVKKRLLPVIIGDGAGFTTAPPTGTPITLDGRDAGELRSAQGNAGIALIRLDAFDRARLEGVPLMADGVPLAAWAPDWMSLPEHE